jgi:hypothetical protein
MHAIRVAVVVGSLVHCCPGQAAENESYFIPAQGRLIIPHLNMGNEIYFVELQRVGSAYTFNLLGPSVTKITPAAGDSWASAAQILGTWKLADDASTTLDLQADGSFTLTLPADNEEPCPAGAETGKYSYNPDTGVFLPRVLTDNNAQCGFSNPTTGGEGPFRMHMATTGLEFWVYDPTDGTVPQINKLTPK